MRAAWKSIEWGMAPLFVSVISTVCPCRAWTTGPGAPPSKPHALYLTPGAISIVTSLRTMCTLTTSPGVVGGSAAGNGLCAIASSLAFTGAAPAKLVPFIVVDEPPLMSCPLVELAAAASSSSARSDATSVAAKIRTAAPRIALPTRMSFIVRLLRAR